MRNRKLYTLSVICAMVLFAQLISCGKEGPPVAKKVDVADTIHGVEVNDPYRWLEDWNDPQVREWSDEQNVYARKYLNNLPMVSMLKEKITKIRMADVVSYYNVAWNGSRFFAMKYQPPLNQSILVVLPDINNLNQETILVDPNALDESYSTSIDWYKPSDDGKFVAVSLSVGGSESGDLYIYNSESGEQVDIIIKKVNGGTAGGDVAWLPDGSGFYYTRYPRQGERPEDELDFYQQVWFHRMGENAESDSYVFGKDAPRIAEFRLQMHGNSGQLIITMQRGDSGEFQHYILNKNGKVINLADYEDRIAEVILSPQEYLFLISLANTPRGKLMRMSLNEPSLEKAETIIQQNENTIISSFYSKSQAVVTKERIYLTYQLGGPSEIRTFDYAGKPLPAPQIHPVSSIYELSAFEDNDILYRNASYIEPPSWFHFDAAFNLTEKTALVSTYPVDYEDCEVKRDFAVSKDGTKIPLSIISRKDLILDGSNPMLLTAYGGFGASSSPGFSSINRVWIDQGGVFAEANIRGGGEFGEEWHRAAMLTNKQNCFDDFAAAMQYMIDKGYTNREKLAIIGGSNGGLLMGAMITQHPDLFKVSIAMVGIYDMIRSELTPNGSFNIPEYGTVKDEAQFRALYAYSPYHNVKEGAAYPAVLFMTGANDPRVDPMHSRKMTAQLQAATASDAPILLRTSSGTGHGYGTPLDEQVREDVHMFSFLFDQMGITYHDANKNEN